ncbi:MAG: saccharopine dehydrogenase C-terminal domain-containing protein [Pyrobaculum sp.]
MRILLLGCGHIGRYIYSTLSSRHEVVSIDKSTPCPGGMVGNALEISLGGFDLVINALPGSIGFRASERALRAGVDTIDVSFYPEDPFSLEEVAAASSARYIPDAGVAPGLSNVLAGRIVAELGSVETLAIYVGGIPERPVGPLGYSVTWSPVDLIEEYTRPARVVREGRVVSVEALGGVESLQTPLGLMEAFYTDGLRTLLKTLKVRNMYEKTLRWPGHIEKIHLLRDLGFFSEDGDPPPRLITARLLSRLKYDVPDVVYMKIVGLGEGREVRYEVLVRPQDGWSAMQIATGSVAAGLTYIVKDLEPGVTPPEHIGMSNKLFPRLVSVVKQHGVKITQEVVYRIYD